MMLPYMISDGDRTVYELYKDQQFAITVGGSE